MDALKNKFQNYLVVLAVLILFLIGLLWLGEKNSSLKLISGSAVANQGGVTTWTTLTLFFLIILLWAYFKTVDKES